MANETQGAAVPSKLLEVPPLVGFRGSHYAFTLQTVVKMQRSLGKVEQAIANLAEQSKKHDDK